MNVSIVQRVVMGFLVKKCLLWLVSVIEWVQLEVENNSERQAILKYAIVANFDSMLSFLPADYLSDWGSPLSLNRFNRIYHHLTSMADLRDGRRNFEVAVSDWRNDANWFKTDHKELVYKYRMI